MLLKDKDDPFLLIIGISATLKRIDTNGLKLALVKQSTEFTS